MKNRKYTRAAIRPKQAEVTIRMPTIVPVVRSNREAVMERKEKNE